MFGSAGETGRTNRELSGANSGRYRSFAAAILDNSGEESEAALFSAIWNGNGRDWNRGEISQWQFRNSKQRTPGSISGCNSGQFQARMTSHLGSSPAGFFNGGFGVIGDARIYGANSSMPIPESSIGNEHESSSIFNGFKRNRDGNLNIFPSSNHQESESGLIRAALRLPKTSSSSEVEKYIHLPFQQELIPCHLRAKRGCATHPRSIAERLRRTRISEKIKKLQELFPNMDKVHEQAFLI